MSNVQPAVKYRPSEFADIHGQDDVVEELLLGGRNNSLGQFLLFKGPHGVGKTSTALALAAAIQCEDYQWSKLKRCGRCNRCKKVNDYLDHFDCSSGHLNEKSLRRIARHIGVPALFCKISVLIFEEVHALGAGEQRKLLLPLERRSTSRQITIFTTTEATKIIPPLLSRLVEYRFKRPELSATEKILRRVNSEMRLGLSNDDLRELARLRNGDCRLAVNLLPRLRTKRQLNPEAGARDLISQL
jgi:DNA polymerase-3 subunit gamma/tau